MRTKYGRYLNRRARLRAMEPLGTADTSGMLAIQLRSVEALEAIADSLELMRKNYCDGSVALRDIAKDIEHTMAKR